MVISADFKDGRIREFDLSTYTNGSAMTAYERSAVNILTEFDLRLDRLEEDGLRLDFFWFDATKEAGERVLDGVEDGRGGAVSVRMGARRPAYSLTLLEPFELEDVSRILVYRANQVVQAAWRQGSGNWLVKGTLFDAVRVLSYSDSNFTGLNRQAIEVFSYLSAVYPELDRRDVAALMGYELDAVDELFGREPASETAEDDIGASSSDGGGGFRAGKPSSIGGDFFGDETGGIL